jgi:hypothetical protein
VLYSARFCVALGFTFPGFGLKIRRGVKGFSTYGYDGQENVMTLDEALRIVKNRYGLRDSFVSGAGLMMYVVAAENELRAIPGVHQPESGIALLAPEVIELAKGAITIESLVRSKNPEIFRKRK